MSAGSHHKRCLTTSSLRSDTPLDGLLNVAVCLGMLIAGGVGGVGGGGLASLSLDLVVQVVPWLHTPPRFSDSLGWELGTHSVAARCGGSVALACTLTATRREAIEGRRLAGLLQC